jgi:hypothetical protein
MSHMVNGGTLIGFASMTNVSSGRWSEFVVDSKGTDRPNRGEFGNEVQQSEETDEKSES